MLYFCIYKNDLCSFFSTLNPYFHWTVHCCCHAVFKMAGVFNGDLSKWDVGNVVNIFWSMYILFAPSPGLFFIFSCCLFCALILVLYNTCMLSSHFFSNPFLSSVWPCVCLQWWSLRLAGRESDEHGIKYVHSFPPSPRSGLFYRLLLFPFFFLWQH